MSATRALRLFVVGVVATIAMGWAAASSEASRGMSVTNGVTLFSANGTLTISGGGNTVTCTVTLGFELASSIPKTVTAPIAWLLPSGGGTRFSGCSLGITATLLDGPMVGYDHYEGTLPNVTVLGGWMNPLVATSLAFLLNWPIFGSCLYTGGTRFNFNRNTATGQIDTVVVGEGGDPSVWDAPVSCPRVSSVDGILTVQATKPVIALV